MKSFFRAVIILILGLGSAPTANAADSVPYSKFGTWEIMVDISLAGCFMITQYDQGTIFRIGFNKTSQNGYLMVANPAWRSIEPGKEYKLAFRFDGEPAWSGTFLAVDMGKTVALLNSFNDSQFMSDIAVKQTLSISYGGTVVTNLPLTGTYGALQLVVQCQDKVDEILKTTPSAQGGSDPFARR